MNHEAFMTQTGQDLVTCWMWVWGEGDIENDPSFPSQTTEVKSKGGPGFGEEFYLGCLELEMLVGHPGGEIQEVPEDAFRTSEKSENFTQVSC